MHKKMQGRKEGRQGRPVQIYLPEDLANDLEALAAASKLTKNEIVILALRREMTAGASDELAARVSAVFAINSKIDEAATKMMDALESPDKKSSRAPQQLSPGRRLRGKPGAA